MATTKTEEEVRKILANVPGCCRENALRALADSLRARGLKADADGLHDVVFKLSGAKANLAKGKSKYIPGAPAVADRYYESCAKKYKSRSDVEEYCVETTLRIICRHIPGLSFHPICKEH